MPTDRSLRSAGRLDELVKAIFDADATKNETTWVEWKLLDLDSKEARFLVAQAILGFANRLPDSAARHCEGEAYVVVGVQPGTVAGVPYFDAAALSHKFGRYVEGVDWVPDYVEFEGELVLVVTVPAPRPGDRIHTLITDFGKSLSGTVFHRGTAQTEPAGHRVMQLLQDRLRQAPPESGLDRFTRAVGEPNAVEQSAIVRAAVRALTVTVGDRSRFALMFGSGCRGEQRVRQYVQVAQRYRDVVDPLLSLVRLGSQSDHVEIWRDAMEDLVSGLREGTELVSVVVEELQSLTLLPATLVMYVAALGAVESGQYGLLEAVTVDARVRASRNRADGLPAAVVVGPWESISKDCGWCAGALQALVDPAVDEQKALSAGEHLPSRWSSWSTYLFYSLREVFADRTDGRYRELFDQAELLMSLILADLAREVPNWLVQPWYGLFVRSVADSFTFEASFAGRYLGDVWAQGAQWAPLRANLFGGDPERVAEALRVVTGEVSNWRQR